MNSPAESNSKSGRKLWAMLIGLIVVVMGLIGVVVALFLSGQFGAQAEGPPATQPVANTPVAPSPNHGTKGAWFVVTVDVGKPIKGVNLWVLTDSPQFPAAMPGDHTRSATLHTDAQGKAGDRSFPRVPINVMASMTGYAPVFSRGIQIEPGKDYAITLHAGATVSGRVLDDQGKPLANVQLTAERTDSLIHYEQEMKLKATSDANGGFTMPHAADGKYRVTLEPPKDRAYLAVDGAELEVAGGKSGASVELQARRGASISGRFVSDDGGKISGNNIYIFYRGPVESQRSVKSDSDGNFTLSGISPGAQGGINFMQRMDYSMKIEWPNQPSGIHINWNNLQFRSIQPGSYDGLVVRLVKMAHVTGQITDENGKPITGVYVSFPPVS